MFCGDLLLGVAFPVRCPGKRAASAGDGSPRLAGPSPRDSPTDENHWECHSAKRQLGPPPLVGTSHRKCKRLSQSDTTKRPSYDTWRSWRRQLQLMRLLSVKARPRRKHRAWLGLEARACGRFTGSGGSLMAIRISAALLRVFSTVYTGAGRLEAFIAAKYTERMRFKLI